MGRVSCWMTLQDTLTMALGNATLFVYAIVLAVLIRFSKTTFNRPFFTFCISLGFVEMLSLLRDIAKPAVLQYMRENDNPIFQSVYGGLDRLPWFAILYHQVYIAFERVTALLYPKIHSKLWSFDWMCFHFASIGFLTLACNICIISTVCPYVLYEDGVTNFYNLTDSRAYWHNRIVDLALQPCVFLLIVLVYIVTGLKIIKLRNQIGSNINRTKNEASARRRRLEVALVLQGVLIATPQTVTMILYHILIYAQLPLTLTLVLKFFCSLFSKLVYSSSPFLYLFMNADVRTKLAVMLAGNGWAAGVSSMGRGANGNTRMAGPIGRRGLTEIELATCR